MTRLYGPMLAVLATAGAAHATFFSFASDNDDASWTWTGSGSDLANAQDPTDPVTLLIDDQNGGLPPLEMDVEFEADFTLNFNSSIPVGGDVFIHTYVVDGEFTFREASGAPVLAATFEGAILTAPGSENAWSSAAAVLGSDSFTTVTYESFISEPDYELFEGLSIASEDFGFDLTVINTSGNIPFDGEGLGVALDEDGLPLEVYFAEGSFSGSATFIPAPGAVAVLGLGGLAATRRRRRRPATRTTVIPPAANRRGGCLCAEVAPLPAPERPGDELASVSRAQLAVQRLDVIVHGVGTAADLVRNRTHRHAAREQSQDLVFAIAEPASGGG